MGLNQFKWAYEVILTYISSLHSLTPGLHHHITWLRMNSLRNEMLKAWNLSIFRRTVRKYGRQEYYRAFLLRWPASLQIYLKTKKRLHIKTIIQLPLDCIVTPTWPPFHFLEHNYGRLGVRVETFYTAVKFVFVFQSRIHVCQLLLTHLLLQLVHFGYQVIYLVQGPWKKREPLKNFRYVIQLYDIICSHHL